MLKRWIRFLSKDLWLMNIDDLPKNRGFFIRQLRVIVLAIRGFNEDKVSLHATALSLFSVLSVVPILALAFGIAKGFGLEVMMQEEIKKAFVANPDIANFLIDFATTALSNTKGGLIAGIGVVVLLFTAMRVLNNIEVAFNEVWQIKKPRPLFRKFSDYLTMILVGPILVLLSSSLTVFISTSVTRLIDNYDFLEIIAPFIEGSLSYVPYLIMWLVFTLLYVVMPNTKVKFGPALFAGIIIGTVFQLFEQAYIFFQVEVSTYNAIYGSFAAIPLFIIWMQASWLMILFGAELSFAHQNVSSYQFESGALEVNDRQKRLLAVLMLKGFIDNIHNHEEPVSAPELSIKYHSPIRLIRKLLDQLLEVGYIREVVTKEESKEGAYQLAVESAELSLYEVLNVLETRGNVLPLKESEMLKRADEVLEKIKGDLKK
ncbi:MAG TPA: YihY/virulence factor BrkB family protein, partial [Flavobacteriales bacterium]|nr:YihY/virulence factor BrkB family protein [Flavobacteriales bacterium]